jgi:hypothetical protein
VTLFTTDETNAPLARKLLRRRVVHWAAALGVVLSALVGVDSGADSGVPLSLQVRLLARLSTYDRNFRDRVGSIANVLVVHRKGDADSAFEEASLIGALGEIRVIGGVPIHVEAAEFSDVDSLAKRCRRDKIAFLYLTVGLEAEMPRLTSALAGGDILTVGTTAQHAENGAVVGFALEEARPKLVINLPRAQAQHVEFRADVLALARLIK